MIDLAEEGVMMQMFKVREVHSQACDFAYIKPSLFYHTQYTITTNHHTYLLQKDSACITVMKDNDHLFTTHMQYQVQSIAQAKIKPPRVLRLTFLYHSNKITLIPLDHHDVHIYINDVLKDTILFSYMKRKVIHNHQVPATLYALCLILAHWILSEDILPIIY